MFGFMQQIFKMELTGKITWPYRFLSRKLILIRNWYIPNFKNNINNRIAFEGSRPSFNQHTIFSGKGKLTIGPNCVFGYKLGGRHKHGSVELQPRNENSVIVISENVQTNNNVFICAANYIEIKKDTLIGEGVTIMDFEAHGLSPNNRRQIGEIGSVEIGRNVWIGNNVTILKNTIIGDNTIVAAGAVVSGIFPDNAVIGGVPAKVIKQI